MGVLEDLRQSVMQGEMDRTQELVRAAISEKVPAARILNDGLISGMSEVGRMFECGDLYVPEMLIAARAMKSGLVLLRPHLVAANVKAIGKVVIGTVQGDVHDIGKNLVGMMLEGAGFEIIDLGADVPPEKYVEAVREHRPDLIACSALLTTTMLRMKDILSALNESGLRSEVKVMVGGAPITQDYATDIGADLYAPDAASAAARARELVSAKQ